MNINGKIWNFFENDTECEHDNLGKFWGKNKWKSVIKRPIDSTTSTTSGQTDTTMDSTTGGQTSTTNGQSNGQTGTTSG